MYGDYRESCLNIRNEEGCMGSELLYRSFEILKGKPVLKALPASFATEQEVVTLQISCLDDILNLRVELLYSVFYDSDVITRSVRVSNEGKQTLKLEKIYSACLDMENQDFEMISLHGSWPSRTSIHCFGYSGYEPRTWRSVWNAFCLFG